MHKLRNTILWSFIAVIVLMGVIVLLGALNDSDGQPLIENAGALIGTLITTVGLMFSGILAIVVKSEKTSESVTEDTRAIRDQLENAHVQDPKKVSNIRDDLDTKASKDDVAHVYASIETLVQDALGDVSKTLLNAIASLDRRIEGSASDIRGMRKDIGAIRQKQDKMEERIDTVEKTITGSTQIIKAAVLVKELDKDDPSN